MRGVHLRKALQLVFFVVSVLLFVGFAAGIIAHSAHNACPYSAICFGSHQLRPDISWVYLPLFRIGGFTVTMPLVGIVVAVAALFTGRLFCGWVCPFGTLQGWLYGWRRGKSRFVQRVPYKAHRRLVWLKYVVLAATAVLAVWGLQRLYMGFCPVLALAHPQVLGVAGVVTLAVIVVGGIFVERLWCRYLCPYAALMGLFIHLGNWLHVPRHRVNRNIKTSLECFRCLNYCPMWIDIGYNETITSAECILCRNCVRRCTKTKEGKKACLYAD